MINSELINYVKKTKNSFSKQQIKEVLLKTGWNEPDIDEAFKFISKKPRSFLNFFIFFLIIALFFGGSLFFVQKYFKISENAISANLLANLTNLEVNQVESKKKLVDEKPITLLFVGDIMLDRGVENIWQKYNNSQYPFLNIFKEIEKADLAFGNLEGSISERGANLKIKYSFRFSQLVIDGLKFAGFDVLSLANNHSFDWGREALEDTVNILRENDILPIGAGMNYLEANSPAIKNIAGAKVAFLAYENIESNSKYDEATKDLAGKSSFNLERVKEEIYAMKQLEVADIIIVSMHWGEEYQLRSNKKQQEIGRALVEAGTDIIIGHHPHVIQEIERYKNGWIAYSLGNFIFDQNFSKETMEGLMLKAIIQDKKIVEIEPVEIKINSSFQPEIIGL